MSVCTGTVMRFTDYETPRWVDTLSGANSPSTYAALTSEFCGLIHFIDHIHPVRAGLLSTYLQQAICSPACKYDPTKTVVPL